MTDPQIPIVQLVQAITQSVTLDDKEEENEDTSAELHAVRDEEEEKDDSGVTTVGGGAVPNGSFGVFYPGGMLF